MPTATAAATTKIAAAIVSTLPALLFVEFFDPFVLSSLEFLVESFGEFFVESPEFLEELFELFEELCESLDELLEPPDELPESDFDPPI